MECGNHQSITERYEYNPETGALFNRAGKLLRSKSVRICGKAIEKPRLIWFLQTGKWIEEVDHKDGNHYNDRWLNLRESTHSQNMMNRGVFRNSSSGIKGVSLHRGKWRARIAFNHKLHDLGYYDDIHLAFATRIQAGWDFHGEFSRY